MTKSKEVAAATAAPAGTAEHTPPDRVHHQGPTGQQSAVDQGQNAGAAGTVNDEQLLRMLASQMNHQLPSMILFVSGQPQFSTILPQPTPPSSKTAAQAAQDAGNAITVGLTTQTDGFWDAVNGAVKLRFLADGLNPDYVRQGYPYNSGQVLAGGAAVLFAVQTDPKAACMEMDTGQLTADMALAVRAGEAKKALGALWAIADATESVALNRVADRIDAGLTLGESTIEGKGNLKKALGPALEIKGGPAAQGVASRAENARTEEEIRADEQQKQQGGTGAAGTGAAGTAPAQTTTTVTTQNSGGQGVGQGQGVVAVPAKGRRKKK